MPSDQLLVKTLLFENIQTTGEIRAVRFNLPRGRVARILGFNSILRSIQSNSSGELFVVVRKPVDVPVDGNAKDQLWTWSYSKTVYTLASVTGVITSQHYNLPKPYRCTGISVMVSTTTNDIADFFLNIYYDTDNMTKDEDVQYLESTRQRGHRQF